jgi:hypothetical protein
MPSAPLRVRGYPSSPDARLIDNGIEFRLRVSAASTDSSSDIAPAVAITLNHIGSVLDLEADFSECLYPIGYAARCCGDGERPFVSPCHRLR